VGSRAGWRCPTAPRVPKRLAVASACPPSGARTGSATDLRTAAPAQTGPSLLINALVRFYVAWCLALQPTPSSMLCAQLELRGPRRGAKPVCRRRALVPPPSAVHPVIPDCSGYPDCTSCTSVDECAWCASESRCLTVNEVFSTNCRGTVYDLPCPSSFVGGMHWSVAVVFRGSCMHALVGAS
jgi:hypothetical protein